MNYERIAEISERSMQFPVPMNENFHRKWILDFIERFLDLPGIEAEERSICTFMGNQSFFDIIEGLVMPCYREILRCTGLDAIEKFIVFVGSGEVMEEIYCGNKNKRPPYRFAVYGGSSCFINTDWIKDRGIDNPAVKRAIPHEVSHVIWNLALRDDNGEPDFRLLCCPSGRVIHEALGGPLDIGMWKDIIYPQGVEMSNFAQGNIWFKDWYEAETNRLGFQEHFFLNPVAKEFYRWAAAQGDKEWWWNRAKAIVESES